MVISDVHLGDKYTEWLILKNIYLCCPNIAELLQYVLKVLYCLQFKIYDENQTVISIS